MSENKKSKDEFSLVEQVFPTEIGMIQSIACSKSLLLIFIIGVLFFLGFILLLIYMAP